MGDRKYHKFIPSIGGGYLLCKGLAYGRRWYVDNWFSRTFDMDVTCKNYLKRIEKGQKENVIDKGLLK